MKFMRSLFGSSGPSSTRTVVGNMARFESKDVEHIRDSEAKITALYHLSKKFAGTLHEHKVKLVYEKTKNIHHYLVSRNRVHELALFHLQHTDHFINTFQAIIGVFQKHQPTSPPPPPPGAGPRAKKDPVFTNFTRDKHKQEKKRKEPTMPEVAELLKDLFIKNVVKPQQAPNGPASNGQAFKGGHPALAVPEITINTFERIPYSREETMNGLLIKEIGYLSTVKEKESFLQYVSVRLGIQHISYVGNTLVSLPDITGSNTVMVVPVIHWNDFLYALNLNDFRIFPVKMFRKGR